MSPSRADRPVLIIGTERSGSNMLRLVLDSHSRFAVPHPPHFMRYLAPHAASYGDLRVERNRRLLARDALTLLAAHINPWPHPVDEDRVVAEAGPSVFGVVAAIYEQHRRAEGKPSWGCKSTFMVDHVAEVLADYPAARFVWLVRDPRDVAASARHSVFGPCHPWLVARLWRDQQRTALAARERWGPGTVRLLRYEDLVAAPEASLRGLMADLGEEFEPAMLEHHRSPEARRTARLSRSWENTARPISADRVGRHGSALGAAGRAAVEAVAGAEMAALGYPAAEHPAAARPPAALRLREPLLRAGVEIESLRHDRNVLLRWRREAVVRGIRVRARLRAARTDQEGSDMTEVTA